MPKPASARIFIKIYLWFLLAIAVVVTAQLLIDRLTNKWPQPGHHQHPFNVALNIYGQAGLDRYLHGDTASLAALTKHLEDDYDIKAYIVDESGVEISGRQLPPDAIRIRPQPEDGPPPRDGKDVMALAIKGADGRQYNVIGVLPPDPFRPGPKEPFMLFLRLIAVIIVLGLPCCYILARYITSPIIKLSEATQRFSAGDLKARIGPALAPRNDEISDLAGDFDKMAERLETLMRLHIQLLGDISHELRSPLARLNVALELARKKTGEEARRELDRIELESARLGDMIGQVLTLTSLDNGVRTLQTGPVDLARLVGEIAKDAQFETQGNRGVRVIECAGCVVNGNEELLRRAIENVVRNAIRHTGEDTTVDITLRRITGAPAPCAEITVRDHGHGIPEADLTNIFRPFYRASYSRDRRSGGAGLGLSITERAVAFHHGTVAASNAGGGGLIVTITLPLVA